MGHHGEDRPKRRKYVGLGEEKSTYVHPINLFCLKDWAKVEECVKKHKRHYKCIEEIKWYNICMFKTEWPNH